MDFENILYVIGAIIYLLYSAGKGAKKHKQNRPGQTRPKPEPENTNEDKIREMLERKREEFKRQAEMAREETFDSMEDFVEEQRRQHSIVEEQRKAEQQAKEAEERLKRMDVMDSVEYDDSTLEDHVTMKSLKRKASRPSRGAQMVRNGQFNARKAFVFSEIFNKKY